jgi:uncharacterized repeat protein (TIGR01451 family)
LGLPAVKLMAESTAQSTRILGGNEFAGGITAPTDLAGIQILCPDATASPDPACTPQQAFYNTIAEFFDGTAAANLVPRLYDATVTSQFPTLAGGTTTGAAPLNYLEVYYGDISDAASAAEVTTGEGTSPTYSAQDMLALASQGLALTSEQPLPVPAASLSIATTPTGSFFQGQSGATYTVTVSNGASGVATVGLVTVIDTIPAGLTLVSMSGKGWTCPSNVCTRSDALNLSSSYPPISVTVNVAPNAPSPGTNQVTVRMVPGSEDMFSARWSPDGKHLVAIGDDKLRPAIYDFETRHWADVNWADVNAKFFGYPTWSKDSKYVYGMLYAPQRLARIDVATRKLEEIRSIKEFGLAGNISAGVSWTPDGEPVVLADRSTFEIYRLDVEW